MSGLRFGVVLAFACALAACERGAAPPVAEVAPAPVAEPVAPAPVAEASNHDVPMFTYEDVAGVAFGDSVAALAQAWPGGVVEATGEPQGACHFVYAQPRPTESYGVAFVFDADRLVRVEVDSRDELAPGGGHVGMSAEAVRAAYPGLVEKPHDFVPGGRLLTVTAPGGASRLVFEVNPSGNVTAWRLGLAITEGCA